MPVPPFPRQSSPIQPVIVEEEEEEEEELRFDDDNDELEITQLSVSPGSYSPINFDVSIDSDDDSLFFDAQISF